MNNQNIIRTVKNKDNPYVIINKSMFSDTSISWKAKGILGYLLSKPDNWSARVGDLVNQSTDGEKAIYSALKELRASGYMQYVMYRSRGKNVRTEYVIYEFKQENIPDLVTVNLDTEDYFLLSQNGEGEKLQGESRVLNNKRNILNTENNNNISLEDAEHVKKASSVKTEKKKRDKDPILEKIKAKYSEVYGKTISSAQAASILTVCQDIEKISEAIQKSKDSGGNSVKYLIEVLKNPPKQTRAPGAASNKPEQFSNYTDRKYDDAFFENLYENT